ncbi:MAG: prephenate dehydrogenase/arogenate dehydrogenase family protein [Eggerthellaceae bacterium]
MDRQIESIAVIGLGLIGASFAGAYRKAYPDAPILGVDVSQEAIDELLDRGWITQGFGPNAPELPEALNTCDLVVIATPVGSVPEYFRMLADCDYQGIITDTCSTKAQIVEEAQAILPHLDHFIPGHPMAGSEKSGVTGSRDNLFENAHWVLCPDEHTSPDAFAALHEVLTALGARVVSLTREGHDEAVAIISHVPHFVASSLVELAVRHAGDQEALFRLAAGGFKDSTRIAAVLLRSGQASLLRIRKLSPGASKRCKRSFRSMPKRSRARIAPGSRRCSTAQPMHVRRFPQNGSLRPKICSRCASRSRIVQAWWQRSLRSQARSAATYNLSRSITSLHQVLSSF